MEEAWREREQRQAMMQERVNRIRRLAGSCAEVAVKDIEDAPAIDEAAQWLAITGKRDPDDRTKYTNEEITEAIIDVCYIEWFSGREYDDVRFYMLSR